MKRRLARIIALQSLYQMEMNQVAPGEAIETAIEEAVQDNEANLDMPKNDISTEYAEQLVFGVERHLAWIDRTMAHYLKGWQLDRLSRVDRQVLRLAAFELIFRDDVPTRSVINEAIELAKYFGTEESGKFVNGVLGNLVKDLEQLKAAAQVEPKS